MSGPPEASQAPPYDPAWPRGIPGAAGPERWVDEVERSGDQDPFAGGVGDDPFPLLRRWMAEVEAVPPRWAAALATATRDGRPSVRMVLVKGVDPGGLVFYTDGSSHKGRELRVNPQAAVCLHWPTLGRQLRIEGRVRRLPPSDVDAYFHSRPRASQLAAAISHQSEPAPSRRELERRVADLAAALGEDAVPRPRRWAGYRLGCEVVEFWREGPGRLHYRLEYRRAGAGWRVRELQP